MVFIRYSSSFCAGVAPTDVLSFLFVLNNNKRIIILNAVTPGGGTFLKLGLYLILFWKLLKLFSTRGPRGTMLLIGSRETGNKSILAMFERKGIRLPACDALFHGKIIPISWRASWKVSNIEENPICWNFLSKLEFGDIDLYFTLPREGVSVSKD